MMVAEKHIIHRVNIEIEAPDLTSARLLQERALHVFSHEVLPELERWLDSIESNGRIIRIERLDVAMEPVKSGEFESIFGTSVFNGCREHLQQVFDVAAAGPLADEPEVPFMVVEREERLFELLLHFLGNGRLPWWGDRKEDFLEESLLLSLPFENRPGWIERLSALFRGNALAIERLVQQCSLSVVAAITTAMLRKWLRPAVDDLLMLPEGVVSIRGSDIAPQLRESILNHPAAGRSPVQQRLFLHRLVCLMLGERQEPLLQWLNGVDAETRPESNQFSQGQRKAESVSTSGGQAAESRVVVSGEVHPPVLRNERADTQVLQGVATGGKERLADSGDAAEGLCRQDDALLESGRPEAESGNRHKSQGFRQERSGAKGALTRNHDLSGVVREREATDDTEGEGVMVDHAGLVLLHPFFEYFFREFDLLDHNAFRDEAARNTALHLLAFLVTGRDFPAEHELTFEKFLCGVSLDVPVERFVLLEERMKAESETLLKAAISHWQALKNTSPGGLREGFLQREGKLVMSSFENRLTVVHKAHDVLLSYLPWGYGIVKLPWLDGALLVDWAA